MDDSTWQSMGLCTRVLQIHCPAPDFGGFYEGAFTLLACGSKFDYDFLFYLYTDQFLRYFIHLRILHANNMCFNQYLGLVDTL